MLQSNNKYRTIFNWCSLKVCNAKYTDRKLYKKAGIKASRALNYRFLICLSRLNAFYWFSPTAKAFYLLIPRRILFSPLALVACMWNNIIQNIPLAEGRESQIERVYSVNWFFAFKCLLYFFFVVVVIAGNLLIVGFASFNSRVFAANIRKFQLGTHECPVG